VRLVNDIGQYHSFVTKRNNEVLRAVIEELSSQNMIGSPAERLKRASSSLAPEAVTGMVVVGSENRYEVNNPTGYPYSVNAQGFLSDHSKWCTAFMVGDPTAISAAHCHWDRSSNSWYPVSYFRFGHDDGTQALTTNHR
jgi:V8-like Glu-specific endopeptidase